MSNYRREKTREKFGFDSEKEVARAKSAKCTAEQERKRKAMRRERIESNSLYRVLIGGAIGFDILDAVVGFIEGVGDLLSGVVGVAYVYLSLCVVRSLRLTMAVLCVSLTDLLIGLIPVAGTVVDIFFCGSYINRMMIKGFVEDDRKAKRRVNLISSAGFIVVVGLFWLVKTLIGRMNI